MAALSKRTLSKSGLLDNITDFSKLDGAKLEEEAFTLARVGDIANLEELVKSNPSAVNMMLFVHESHDLTGTIKNNPSKRCYTWTGLEKDGYTHLVHVASEAGHKEVVLMLVENGAELDREDYRAQIAEEKANGRAKEAFYELKGLRFEAHERYEGGLDHKGRYHGHGTLFIKMEGYHEEETVLYEGNFERGAYNGQGVLYHKGATVKRKTR